MICNNGRKFTVYIFTYVCISVMGLQAGTYDGKSKAGGEDCGVGVPEFNRTAGLMVMSVHLLPLHTQAP